MGSNMYADFSREQVNAFLQDLTEQPRTLEIEGVAEAFSDEMILAEMELSRFKKAAVAGEVFESRSDKLARLKRMHPADLR